MRDRLLAFARFLLGAAVALIANYLASGLAFTAGSPLRYDLSFRPLLAALLLGGFCLVLMTIDKVEQNPLAAMGLSMRVPWKHQAIQGVLLGAALVTIAVTAIAIGGDLRMTTRLTWHSIAAAVIVLVVLVAGALAEELMFRGYPFQRLTEAIGAAGAVIVLSALFGAVHLLNPHATFWGAVNTALVGVLLSLAYLRTRALWMPWAIHFSWNATLGLVFGLPVSGLSQFSVLIRSRAQGPGWLTGGSYGIEASVAGAIVIVLGIAILLVVTRQMPLRIAGYSLSPGGQGCGTQAPSERE